MLEIDSSKFQKARLIPVTGIKPGLDQERRATSALLAVLKIVPELTWSILRDIKAPKGQIETFIEPEFKIGAKRIRPDGLIVITRGKKEWRALVEVKTGKSDLELTQISQYLDICRDYKIDALITVSNQVLNASGTHPTEGLDLRKLRSTDLSHLSWLRVLTDCIVLSEHTGVDDAERQFILQELIRFLQSDASGASEFNDMGPAWATVREGIRASSIRKPDEAVQEVVSRFESLIRYAALTLSARLGVSAKEVVPRLAKTDYKKHLQASSIQLIEKKTLSGAITIPGAAADLELVADIASTYLHCTFTVSAPSEGRNKSRLNWLLRQIKSGPGSVLVSWSYKHARNGEAPHRLEDLLDKNYEFEIDNGRELALITVTSSVKMGTKRGAGQGGFIDSVVNQFEYCYGEILQKVQPWQAPSPKLSETIKELIPEVSPEGED